MVTYFKWKWRGGSVSVFAFHRIQGVRLALTSPPGFNLSLQTKLAMKVKTRHSHKDKVQTGPITNVNLSSGYVHVQHPAEYPG